jgi:catechol 2,3-dioxygenase-like lactoylglutathione lyase family enzyme
MSLDSFYPVICTDRIKESRDFYVSLFGFEPTFEADWYVSLRRPEPPHYELALVDQSHPTIPAGYRAPVRGLLLNFEVSDVDADHDRLCGRPDCPKSCRCGPRTSVSATSSSRPPAAY